MDLEIYFICGSAWSSIAQDESAVRTMQTKTSSDPSLEELEKYKPFIACNIEQKIA